MKTLIINGSPRRNGDTASLLKVLRETLVGEVVEISAYYDKISPCIDCRACKKTGSCALKDKMSIIYADDFDNVVIASPVYISSLPGPLLSLASRLQVYYVAKRFLGQQITMKEKTGALILVGGGDGSSEEAKRVARYILKKLKAPLDDEMLVTSLNTDEVPAIQDAQAVTGVQRLALRLNQNEQQFPL